MRFEYFPETDTLYIVLRDKPSVDTHVMDRNIAIDLDEEESPVGIEIEHASEVTDLSMEELFALPTKQLSSGEEQPEGVIERVRRVRKAISQRFDKDPYKLSEHYRKLDEQARKEERKFWREDE